MNDLANETELISKIETLLANAREKVASQVNTTLLYTYMEIGRLIVEDMNSHSDEVDYQSKSISMLSKELTKRFGKGFSRANIWNIIAFYKEYGSVQTLSERLNFIR